MSILSTTTDSCATLPTLSFTETVYVLFSLTLRVVTADQPSPQLYAATPTPSFPSFESTADTVSVTSSLVHAVALPEIVITGATLSTSTSTGSLEGTVFVSSS